MEYFNSCTTLEEVKTKFRSLSKTLHPDKGGNAHEFSSMKEQYDEILETGIIVKAKSFAEQFEATIRKYPKTPTEATQHLDPEELENLKATNYFNKLRESDFTFDQIDEILKQAKKENLRSLWVFQEVSKLLELNMDHFKYTTWKTGFSIGMAKQLYNKYIGV